MERERRELGTEKGGDRRLSSAKGVARGSTTKKADYPTFITIFPPCPLQGREIFKPSEFGCNPSRSEASSPTPVSHAMQVAMAENQEIPVENVNTDSSLKRRKLRSDVCENFKKVITDKGEQFVCCNHCNKKSSGASSSGTTHLKRHLGRCPRRSHVDVGQQLLSATRNAQDKSLILKNFKFSQARSRSDLARAILKHEYPFNIVEHEFFRTFLKNLQPSFHVVSRNTIRSDVMEIYTMEKEKLYTLLDQTASRISLTTDMWAGDQNDGYLCLTGHYLDDEWKLNKKILNFVKVSDAPNAETLFSVIKKCLLDWNVDKKVSSITVDNCSTNDSMVRKLKEWIGPENLILDGDIFHFCCNAHILNLIVQDGMSLIKLVIFKVRESVKYVEASPNQKLKWQAAMSHLKFKSSKGLCQDVSTRWNVTFFMLESALEFKDVFARLEQIDEGFTTAPSKEEWAMAKTICDILKHFYNASKLFSDALFQVFSAYETKYGAPHVDVSYDNTSSQEVGEIQERLMGFDNWCQVTSTQFKKSELDLYLEEPMFPRVPKFDILGWWKSNAPKYPTLSKVARDILTIPVSTVASESAFSTSGRVLDPYRSSLLPQTVEALICGQDWVQPERNGQSSSSTEASSSNAPKETPAHEIFLEP